MSKAATRSLPAGMAPALGKLGLGPLRLLHVKGRSVSPGIMRSRWDELVRRVMRARMEAPFSVKMEAHQITSVKADTRPRKECACTMVQYSLRTYMDTYSYCEGA